MSTNNPYYASPAIDDSLFDGRRLTIQRIGPTSTARMMGALNAFVGLIAGVFVSLATLVGQANNNKLGAPAAMIGITAVVVLPVVYGLLGGLAGLLGAVTYNLIASAFGGIEIHLSRP